MGDKMKKTTLNIVHHNQILTDTIRKEQRYQKLYTKYSINPWNQMSVVAGKPNSYIDLAEGERDEEFLKTIHRHAQEPFHKYTEPQTTSQEYGWLNEQLIKKNRADPRLHWPQRNSEITKYMEATWKSGGMVVHR